MDVQVVIGQTPEPEKNPFAKVNDGRTLTLFMQEEGDPETIIKRGRKMTTFPEWYYWLGSFKDPHLDPVMAWLDPYNNIPDKYWNYHIVPSNLPPNLRPRRKSNERRIFIPTRFFIPN